MFRLAFPEISSYSVKIVRLVKTAFIYLIFILSFFIGIGLTILVSLFYASKDRHKRFQKSAKTWAQFICFISGIPVNIYGAENIPRNEAVILASNHQGAADILILLSYLPSTFAFIIKKELFRIPLFGWYLRKAGYILLERGTSKGAVNMFSDAVRQLKAGGNILIFPEGTRSPDGNLQPFKRGSLLLAFKANVRVVPIAISGSFNILPRKSWVINPVPVKLKIGQPISLDKHGGDYNLANEDLFKIIQQMLLELRQ